MGGSPWSLVSVRRCGRSIAAPHMRLPRGDILLAFDGGCDVECDWAHCVYLLFQFIQEIAALGERINMLATAGAAAVVAPCSAAHILRSVNRGIHMTLPGSAEELLAIALRYVETGDGEEIASVVARLSGFEEEQAMAIMRGSDNELDQVESLVALSVSHRLISRSDGIRILDEVATHSPGARL